MANTTNLNLVKPAGTDHALVAQINSNMDIIDGAIGALPSGKTIQGQINEINNNIGKTTLVVNATSISAFETGINSILASMQDTEVRALRVTSSITNNGFKSGVTYSGYITRLSSGWGTVSLVDHTGVDMMVGISGGTYFYNSLTDKVAPTTVQNIGRSPGNANAVMVRKVGKIAFLVFNGAYHGFDLPSDCVPDGGPFAITFNQRNVLIAGIGVERWPAHIEGNMESVSIYIHKNGGETQLPADGTYNVFGTAIYITN